MRGLMNDPDTDTNTSQNDVVGRAYSARDGKDKSGRVYHNVVGVKAKWVSSSLGNNLVEFMVMWLVELVWYILNFDFVDKRVWG